MRFDQRHYVPCLRWKQGEYQALLHLSSKAKDFITPLIEVPEIGFDFATGAMSKSVDQHLSPFARRVKKKWNGRRCFVDTKLIGQSEVMHDGSQPVTFVFDGLRTSGCAAVPVTDLGRNREYQRAVRTIVSKDNRGVCVRVNIEDAAKATLRPQIDALLRELALKVEECDLILDLGAPNFEPVAGFAGAVEKIVRRLPHLSRWRTFTIIGTSFPRSMAEVKRNPEVIPRSEWLLYKNLIGRLVGIGVRLPTFGDYAVNHPSVPELDWRLTKPFATIRYTIDDAWLIIKGRNVRDYKFEQYRGLCRALIASGYYLGAQFSHGDCHIANCARRLVSTGNLTTWRWVGTNHHLQKVTQDISSFFSSSDTS